MLVVVHEFYLANLIFEFIFYRKFIHSFIFSNSWELSQEVYQNFIWLYVLECFTCFIHLCKIPMPQSFVKLGGKFRITNREHIPSWTFLLYHLPLCNFEVKFFITIFIPFTNKTFPNVSLMNIIVILFQCFELK